MTAPAFPPPRNPATVARWAHTALRRRILYDDWEADLQERLRQAIGHVRKAAWGIPDLSSNLLRSSVTQLAALYDREPTIEHDQPIDALVDLVRGAGLWSLMARVQRDCLGLREMLVRVEVVGEEGEEEICYRPAFPDMIEAEASGEYPEDPVRIREGVLRTVPDTDRKAWTFDVFDISNPASPSYRIEDDEGRDVSADFGAQTLVGESYPWRRTDGRPVLPYVLYHAARTGCLWDPTDGRALVEATLNLGVFWTFFGHVMTNCSWPQRYAVNARVPGAAVESDEGSGGIRPGHVHYPTGSTPRDGVVTDPATVLMLESDTDNPGAIMIGQWQPGADPAVVQEAVALYERRAAATGGISPADVQRVAGDPRSGFAISITREAQREAQRRFEPQFRRGDQRLIALSAILWNRATGASLPESGYRIRYESLPPSPEERTAEREHLLAMIDAGLLDRVTAYQQLHPGTTYADAVTALARIKAINETTSEGEPNGRREFDADESDDADADETRGSARTAGAIR